MIERTTSFQVTDRVRLSELGKKRAPRARALTGAIVNIPRQKSGGQTVEVLFDGNSRPTRIHRSYIEIDDAQETEN
jgi:hypothetical protein